MEREDFSEFLSDVDRYSIFSLSLMLGHNLGLFDVLCNTDQPLSLQEIAERTKLKERYTKEWLSSMVAARIIHQDRGSELYILPESHRKDIKVHLSLISGMRSWINRSDLVQSCFRQDGPYGFHYDEDPEWFDWFHDYRTTTSALSMDKEMIPFLTKCGVTQKLDAGIKVLDVGCGSGRFINDLGKKFPKSNFTGVDFSEKGLALARECALRENLGNVSYIKGDAHDLPNSWSGQFDWTIIGDALHDLHDPFKALREMYAVLKADGVLSVFDNGFHSKAADNSGDMNAAMVYTMSMFCCLPSSMKEEPHIGHGACWGTEEIEKALKGAAFVIKVRLISKGQLGPTAFYHCTKQ